MPTEILLKIFAVLDDFELLQVAGTCIRLESIAQNAFSQRYAAKYFTVNGKYTESAYETMIQQFHDGIKSIEVHKIDRIDEKHWLTKILGKCHIERLKFVQCNFENVRNALINHPNLTHLTFDGGRGNSFVKLPYLHRLREFKMRHFDGMYYADCVQVIRNNLQLRVIEIVDDSFNNPCEIIDCVYAYHLNLDRLCVINEAKPLRLSTIEELDEFQTVAQSVESMGISIDIASVGWLRRLSANCKNLTRLELFHVGHTLRNGFAEIIASFQQIKSLTLDLRVYEAVIVSIAEKLPNLNELSLKYRCQTPTSNDYILTLLQKCEKLNRIVVDARINCFQTRQPVVTTTFRNNFRKSTESRQDAVIFESKENGRTITTVTNQRKTFHEKKSK